MLLSGSVVVRRKNIEWLPYAPPEVLLTDAESAYKTEPCNDVWQFGIVLFVCVTGCLPWQKASKGDDLRYSRYLLWHEKASASGATGLLAAALVSPRRRPKLFKLLTSRGQRMFRKLMEPKPEKRTMLTCASTPGGLSGELAKFIDDKWLVKVIKYISNNVQKDYQFLDS